MLTDRLRQMGGDVMADMDLPGRLALPHGRG
jgi:hypothetical protein